MKKTAIIKNKGLKLDFDGIFITFRILTCLHKLDTSLTLCILYIHLKLAKELGLFSSIISKFNVGGDCYVNSGSV